MKQSLHIVIFFLSVFMSGGVYAVSPVRQDSLKKVLDRIPDYQKRMDLLDKAAEEHLDTEEELLFLEMMVEEAHLAGKAKDECDAWGNLSRNYYNREDSLSYLEKCADALLQIKTATGVETEDLIIAQSFVCFKHISLGNYETSMNIADEIFKRATQENNQYALITSYEIMATTFYETRRYREAIQAYQNAIKLTEKERDYNPYTVQLQTGLVEAALADKNYVLAMDALQKLGVCIDHANEKGRFLYVDRCKWLMESYYVQMYTELKLYPKALEHLTKGSAYIKVKDGWCRVRHYYSAALYHQAVGDARMALEDLDQIADEETMELYELRAALLSALGRNEEAVKILEKDVALLHDRSDNHFTRQLNELLAKHDVYRLKLETQRAQLDTANLRANIFLFSGVLLVIISLVFILLFLRMRRLKNRLEYASQVKRRFMQNMNHEIRTPLNAIIGFSSVVADMMDKDSDSYEMMQLIQTNSKLLMQLVSDTLDATELEVENLRFDRASYDLVEIGKEVMKTVGVAARPEVELCFSPERNTVRILTDKSRLEQLLINLLMNAIKFTKQGKIELAFRVDEATRKVYISVTDTGRGIPLDKQETVFERFVKLDAFAQGSGLGLSICRQIAEGLQGRIYIDSSYSGGTRFILEHPLDME